MPVIATNVLQGPADLYVAMFGAATEPAETVAALTADPPAPWIAVGGTTDGVTINVSQEYAKLRVDQIPDNIGARLTERVFTVETNMAEATLDNLAVSLNELVPAAAATGVRSFEPASGSSSAIPKYRALLIDGWAPEGPSGPQRRRVIVRKVLSTEGVEFAYGQEDQTVYAVTFEGFYVSPSIKPFKILDAAS